MGKLTFQQFYDLYGTRIREYTINYHRTCGKYGLDPQEAVNETLLRLYNLDCVDQFDPVEIDWHIKRCMRSIILAQKNFLRKFGQSLYKMVTVHDRDRGEEEVFYDPAFDDYPGEDQTYPPRALIEEIFLKGRLTARQKKIFLLRSEGYTQTEVAHSLGLYQWQISEELANMKEEVYNVLGRTPRPKPARKSKLKTGSDSAPGPSIGSDAPHPPSAPIVPTESSDGKTM